MCSKTLAYPLIGQYVACSEQKDDPDEAKLLDEMKAYGDIWRIDMVDTYADLALKTLKMFSILPARVDADFYFKVDDDVAMNVGAMAEYLQSKRSQGNLYLVCNPAQKVHQACWDLTPYLRHPV